MIILLVLGLFLVLTYGVLDAFYTASWNYRTVLKVYKKEKYLILLNSVLERTAELLGKDNNDYDALTELWAKPFQMDTPLGVVKIQIVDLDRYIDVNRVGRDREITRIFENLLNLLHIDNELLDRLMLWNGARKPYGEWDLPFPLKGKPLDSKYEFLYFWNNTGDLYGKKVDLVELPGLLSLITVYSNGKININTTPYWVLRSLDENITDTVAREIMAERLKKPFRSPRDLLRIEDIDMDTLYRFYDAITTKSRYFEITVTLIEKDTNYIITVSGVYDKQRKKLVEKEID